MVTILIWLGSGFAFSMGLLLGMVLLPAVYRKERAQNKDTQDKSLEALQFRNVLSARQVGAMERIASLMEKAAKEI